MLKIVCPSHHEPLVSYDQLDRINREYGILFLRVILIGSIFVEVSVVSEVGAAAFASPVRVLELDTHSSSEADPSESSPPLVYVAPIVSHFLCSDDSESDTEMLERHVLPIPHDAMLTRWRSRVASRSSSPTTSTLEIPTTPILPTPSTVVAPSSEFPLAPVVAPPRICHSSSGHSILGHSLPGHSPPDTIVADSSTPPTFVHPPFTRTPRCSEAYLCWRSPASTVTLSIHDTRVLVPSRADLLPPRKRFRDSISLQDSVEEDIDIDVLVDIEANVMADEVAVDRDVEPGVDACNYMEVDVRVDVEDEVESSDRGTVEVEVDVVVGIDIPDGMLMPNVMECLEQTGQRELEARSLISSRERASLLEQVASLEKSNARLRGTMMMKRARADRFRRRMSFIESELKKIHRFRYYDRMTVGTKAIFSMSWKELMKLMAENNDVAAYTYRFQELTMMCTKMVPEEEDRVKKFIRGLSDNIQGNVIAAEPTRLQDAVHIANNLMDQKLKGYAMKNAERKRRLEVNQRDNRGQKPPYKRQNVGGQNVARAYTVDNNKKKGYTGLCLTAASNRGNKAGKKTEEARGKAYVLGGREANPDSNVVT
nr:hypothetical protein [Tanacetum cinerariifolium]